MSARYKAVKLQCCISRGIYRDSYPNIEIKTIKLLYKAYLSKFKMHVFLVIQKQHQGVIGAYTCFHFCTDMYISVHQEILCWWC